jgi:agmatine deiminase
MIIDKETDFVLFSELIHSQDEYRPAFERIKTILNKHQINYGFLSDTKDIWCRDYMPVQVSQYKFIQFKYEPSYLKEYLDLQSDPAVVLASNGLTAEHSNINLDGGNVINWKDKAILTNRVFKENPTIEPNKLKEELERLFDTKIFFIPDIKEDMTGHADGHLRFVDSKTIVVNELKEEFKYWQTGFQKMIKQTGLDYIEMPCFEHKDQKESAIGVYVNYLEIGKLILFPIFETEGNKDLEAVAKIQTVFPDRIIEPININEIAKEGGLLNCVTWSIKK